MRLERFWISPQVVLGVMRVPGAGKPIYTLERPWHDNKTDISCIPPGRYKIVPYSSEKYPDCYEITGVLGRTKILIHPGNFIKDTRGCILPGLGLHYQSKPMVTYSKKAMDLLRNYLGQAPVDLDITQYVNFNSLICE